MQALHLILLVLLSYLIGSVPFGLLISKSKGVDIRAMGSGNIGATNVLRCLGKPLGIICFALDVLKGYLPVLLLPMVESGGTAWGETVPSIGIFFGVAAILGHNFSVFLRFKGGKGVATSAGVLLGVAPLGVLIGIVVWALVFFTSGYVSLGSVVAAVAVVAVGWSVGYPLPVSIALTLLGALVIWRHRTNIHRLIHRTENRFERKKTP